MKIIDGKKISNEVLDEIKNHVEEKQEEVSQHGAAENKNVFSKESHTKTYMKPAVPVPPSNSSDSKRFGFAAASANPINPVRHPTPRLTRKRTRSQRSSEIMTVQPLFWNSWMTFRPASMYGNPYSPT